jgi:NAD(P)-dependent dehydrogenase (short-subunit alcohol dehydrogenase family)
MICIEGFAPMTEETALPDAPKTEEPIVGLKDAPAGVCPFTGAQAGDQAVPQKEEDQGQPTIILTGASRGIGHATVKVFSDAGWRVITCSRQAFPQNCPWDAGTEDHIQVDLASPEKTFEAIASMKTRIAAVGGKLHALVNNAAISPKGPDGERLGAMDMELERWTRVFQVNLFAPIMLARGLLDELKLAQGAVVNVTSIAGSRVHPFAGAGYATSKAALAALTREMAHDFGRVGVRVNAIAPGEIDTSILSPGTEKIVEEEIPLRRLGTPEEVARVIYMLCTEASSYVNGAEIHINGGQHV